MRAKYYLAYGSNANVGEMKYRCPNATIVGTTFLEGYNLIFKTHLTIEKSIGGKVPIVVWELGEGDELELDRYEGIDCNYYEKNYKEVTVKGEVLKGCLVYIMRDSYNYKLPQITYFERCVKGYEESDLDSKYLLEAMGRTMKYTENEKWHL